MAMPNKLIAVDIVCSRLCVLILNSGFEGKGPQGLGAYGYSRDHREDRPQILLTVATDTQGVESPERRSCICSEVRKGRFPCSQSLS